MEILLKIKSKVVCIINDKEYQFDDGDSAYQELNDKYSIISINAKENTIVFQLECLSDDKVSNWKNEYRQQFGKEPSFF